MDIEKLIEQLNGYFEGKDLKRGVALDGATTLSTHKLCPAWKWDGEEG